tara:strand:- start:2414 stop:4819 length:2406 start_codon:yes stop_codon:yes gene_type:complete
MADYKNLNVAGNVLVSNDVTISGNLSVLGTTTTIESSTVAIEDKDLVLAKDNTTDASASGAGIIIKAGTDKTILYNYNGGNDKFDISIPLDVTGAITGASVATTGTITATGGFVGDGSQITNITAAGISAPGNTTELLFNNAGAFGTDTNLTYDANTNTLATAILTLSTPLAIASGGTGAGTELDARNNLQLGAADNVTFSNIDGADITASGALATSTLVSSGLADLQNGLTVTGGNSTFTNNVTINGNLTANGSLAFADDIFQVGTGSTNTSAIGIRADKGTGTRHGYFTWSKANSRWDAYYSDQTNGGTPFVKSSINADLSGNVTGTVSDISNHDTDALTEGSSNLYYTDERVDDRINALVQAGTNVSVVYDDVANTFTINATATGSGYDLSANDTDDLAEGSTNLYYTDARADARATLRINAATTDNISEGSNLYYTSTRFDTRLATKTTDDLTEGTNLYYTDGRVDAYINASITTDDVSEGANLYYTDVRARAVSIENVVEDASPQLGGNLDLNNNNIDGTGDIDIQGSIKLGAIGSMSATGGEIRWSGTDFLGYDGSAWQSFTAATINQNTTQVANFTNSQAVTSTTYTDIPGYTTAITTTQTNSKIRVSVNLTFSASNDVDVKLVRTVGATDTDIIEINFGSGENNLTNTFVDSPLQTSGNLITYKLQAKVGSGTTTFNNINTNNQISLEEVAITPIAVTSVNGQSGVVTLNLDDIADVDTTSVADGAGLIKDGSDYVATTNNTGAMIMPVGTTAQRPGSPVQGMIRFNTTTSKFEGYNGSDWINLVEEDLGNLS